jgi:hypothetical protein
MPAKGIAQTEKAKLGSYTQCSLLYEKGGRKVTSAAEFT